MKQSLVLFVFGVFLIGSAVAGACEFTDQDPFIPAPAKSCTANPPKDLFQAIEGNCVEAVKSLVKEGAPINMKKRFYQNPGSKFGSGDYTPLILSALRGREEMVEFLLKNGAEYKDVFGKEECDIDGPVRFCGEFSLSVLFYAVRGRSPKIVKTFLDLGLSPNWQATEGYGYPIENVRLKPAVDYTIMGLLFDAGAVADNSESYSKRLLESSYSCVFQYLVKRGLTVKPSHLMSAVASSEDDPDIIAFILSHGVDPNAEDYWGSTAALREAAKADKLKTAAVLLEHRADPNLTYLAGFETFPSLSPSMASVLLNGGLSVTKSTPKFQRSVLFGQFNPETIQLLTSKGADARTVSAVDLENVLTVLFQVEKTDLEKAHLLTTIQKLVQYGASISNVNAEGRSALHYAGKYDYPDVVGYLLDGGASINWQDRDGNTPLSLAAQCESQRSDNLYCAQSIFLLLSRGADVKIANKLGETPLVGFVTSGLKNSKILEALLKSGSDTNVFFNDIRNDWSTVNGRSTPLMSLASWNLQSDSNTRLLYIDLLVAHGAQVNLKNEQGHCALDFANSEEVSKKLISYGAVNCRSAPTAYLRPELNARDSGTKPGGLKDKFNKANL